MRNGIGTRLMCTNAISFTTLTIFVHIKYLMEFEFPPSQEIDKSTEKLADHSRSVVKDFEK